ncbi:hypothetical protein SPHINGOT1_80198 [Sphingomonas sp. T1]|nr:hypothetical protein SPHINGOT1_80198 [Sphingomonas sp. T1]
MISKYLALVGELNSMGLARPLDMAIVALSAVLSARRLFAKPAKTFSF